MVALNLSLNLSAFTVNVHFLKIKHTVDVMVEYKTHW